MHGIAFDDSEHIFHSLIRSVCHLEFPILSALKSQMADEKLAAFGSYTERQDKIIPHIRSCTAWFAIQLLLPYFKAVI